MTISLLKTKLYIPPPRPNLVPRPCLIEQLNAGSNRKLTLISAPAGFGKTTLLSEWIHHLETRFFPKNLVSGPSRPVAWLSLDEGDNDLIRFLTYLVAALQTVDAGISEDVLNVLQSPQPPPPEPLLTLLINDLVDDHYVLVLDDYHLIAAQPIHDALTFLLDHLPPKMHLIIASRADPPLPLARLRARGQLTELRAADLRFTRDEAAIFLKDVMGLELSAEAIVALDARTEGWIAGLQMAALSIQGRKDTTAFIRAFSGSHRFVLDYLVEEVLDRQSSDIQDFLLQTCILERMTGPLCDAVLDIRDWSLEIDRNTPPPIANIQSYSQQILERLEAANLFIVPLDDERRWYRYHHLFADLLRSRLEQTQPDQAPALHRRASEWYEQHGLIAEAVGHAFAAADVKQVARLVEGNAFAMMDHGELTTLVTWFEALPEEMIRSRPWLCVAYAWARIYAGQVDALDPLLLDAEEALLEISTSQAGLDERAAGHIISIRAYILVLRGNMSRGAELAREALERLPKQDPTARGWAASLLANALRWSGDLVAADQAFAEASAISQAAGGGHVAVDVLCDWAGLQIMRGQLRKAAATCWAAMMLADDYAAQSGRRLPVTGYAYVRLSAVLRQWNDLEAALRHAREGIHLCEQWGWAETLIGGYVNLARALEAIGDMGGALDAAQKARQVARGVSPWFDAHAAALEARLWLAQGNLEAASRWAQESGLSIDDKPGFQHLFRYIILARVLIAQGAFGKAAALLARLLEMAEAAGAIGYVIEILILQTLALQAQDADGQALTALERALSLAEPEGYVRVFINEGTLMAELLRQAAARGIALEYVSKLLSALGATPPPRWRDTPTLPHSHTPTLPHPHPSTLIEPLSERELEVLRLLTTSLPHAEIAQELFISINTVRSHIKNIYSKLNVHNRMEAIQRAEELGLT